MKSIFKFKQFVVDQRDCAMKINTDAVLLATLSSVDSPRNILDIGSGTGVISLMLAQRYEDAMVEAVEIDRSAYERSKDNFEGSKFAGRLQVFHSSFEEFSPSVPYDLIISNPPFFINSLHNPDGKKSLAKHTDFNFFKNLLTFSSANLSQKGSLQLILPVDLAEDIIKELVEGMGFYLWRKVNIYSFEGERPIRQIIDLRKVEKQDHLISDHFIIYKKKGVYSEAYQELLSPFFLAY